MICIMNQFLLSILNWMEWRLENFIVGKAYLKSFTLFLTNSTQYPILHWNTACMFFLVDISDSSISTVMLCPHIDSVHQLWHNFGMLTLEIDNNWSRSFLRHHTHEQFVYLNLGMLHAPSQQGRQFLNPTNKSFM